MNFRHRSVIILSSLFWIQRRVNFLKLNRRFGRTSRFYLHSLKVCQVRAQNEAGRKHVSAYCMLKATCSSETSFEFQLGYTALYHRKYKSSYVYYKNSDPILKSYLIFGQHKLYIRSLHIYIYIYIPILWLLVGRARDWNSNPGRGKNLLFSMLSRPVLGRTKAPI
jgi:hypothetical protein